jgi:hypothetical protein
MKNFELIQDGFDVDRARHELLDSMWIHVPEGVHRDTFRIDLRGPLLATKEAIANDTEMVTHAKHAPEVWRLARRLHNYMGSAYELGRVIVVSLDPDSVILPHVDTYGDYVEHYVRFHMPIQSDEGNRFFCGDEDVHMRPGELWWFNHKQKHFVVNTSGRPRWHLMVDLAIPEYKEKAHA